MTALRLTLVLETEHHRDQVEQLARLHEALAKRHGDRFRALDRRIAAFIENPGELELHDLGECIFAATFPAIADLLRTGRDLGVI